MNALPFIVLAVIFLGFATSCDETFTTPIEVDTSHLETKGVIFGLLSNSDPRDSVFQQPKYSREEDAPSTHNRIFLSHSSPVHRNQHQFYNANVVLQSEHKTLPLRYYEQNQDDESFYSVMEALKPGEIYHFAAQYDSTAQVSEDHYWDPVSAVDTMPMPVDIQVIDADIQYAQLSGSESEGYVDIKIQDEPHKRNMYQVEVSIIQPRSFDHEQPLDIIIPTTIHGSQDRVSTEVFGTYHLSLLHEAEFSRHGEKRISFSFHTNSPFFNKEKPITLMVRFSNLSRSYVQFLKSSRQYFAMGDNPFAEPAEVYTNVHNGYGIFACSARSFAQIEVK